MYGPFFGEFMGTLVLMLLGDGAADGYPGPKGWGAKSSAAFSQSLSIWNMAQQTGVSGM
jgi:glycerol uptake facilitator-like aquaporin